MTIFDYVQYLGLYYGEASLQPVLSEFGLTSIPRLPKDDNTTYLSAKKTGIELCFKDERFVNIPGKQLPEGALVVSNIRFYGEGHPGYSAYAGNIYRDITLASTKADVLRAFGIPNAPSYLASGELIPGENDWKMRWDRADHCFFITFDDDGNISSLSIQLPLTQS